MLWTLAVDDQVLHVIGTAHADQAAVSARISEATAAQLPGVINRVLGT